MALSRNQQNYIIMTAIYMELNDFNYGDKSNPRSSKEIILGLLEDYNLTSIPSFVEDMVNVSLFHYGDAVEAFSKNLKDWKWDRLPLLTQAILLMSYIHFYYIEKIDKAIVIDVAVNLAKEYVEEKQGKFVNAILDETLK